MKYVIIFLIIVVAATGLLFLPGNTPENDTAVTGLPWQIEILPDGSTQVFGITLGRTTLGEVLELHGDDLKLAIIAAPHESGSLEAYYSHFSAGPITGKLLLVLEIEPQRLAAMRERAFQEGGMRRYRLHPDDLLEAHSSPIRAISFLPSFNLDDSVVQARFGTPAETVQATAQQQHILYPDRGLEVILSTEGKDMLQYLHPQAFNAHRDQLLRSIASSNP